LTSIKKDNEDALHSLCGLSASYETMGIVQEEIQITFNLKILATFAKISNIGASNTQKKERK
jgi:hypothetical protein